MFDKDKTGFIGVGELKYGKIMCFITRNGLKHTTVLTNLGERMDEEMVDELLAGMNIGNDDNIDYRGQ